MKRAEHSSAFSVFGSPRAKVLLLGPAGPQIAEWRHQGRSFSFEHVSPARLVQQEISRRTPHGRLAAAVFQRGSAVPDQTLLAVLRKWFWARKPDAGFLLEGFPATLLQARVLDEWLEARGENLTAVLWSRRSSDASAAADPVRTHYRTQGLLREAARAAA